MQPAQRSKGSIDNNSQIVKGVTWAQALEGVVDNSGAYLPNVKEKGSDIWGTLQLRPLHNQNLTNRILTKEALKESSHLYLRGVPYKTSNNRILTKEDIVKEHALKTYTQTPTDPRGMVEIVKKITLGSTALTLGKSVRPSQGSKDSIDNNSQRVKGVTWAQALEGVVDNSGAYLPNVKVYNQNPSDPRGMVEIDEQAHEAIIRVFEQADPSTIVHELAHIYLTMLRNAAKLRHTTKT